jgi:hypothetical protein
MLDIFMNLHEFIVGGDVKTRSFQKEGFDNLRMCIGLDCIIALNPGQIFLESPVILSELFVIENKQGSPMLFYQLGNLFFHSETPITKAQRIGIGKCELSRTVEGMVTYP